MGFRSGRLTSSNVATWVLSNQDSNVAPQTLQETWPVCGTKNFVSVRLYSAPQSHWTIVDISSGNERTAVIDPNCHGPPSSDVCHAQPGAEWQRTMSGGQFARIEPFAARGLCSFCVEAGKSMRCNLCLGCIFIRGMLLRDRHTPIRHE